MENENLLPLATEYNQQYNKAAGQPPLNFAAIFLFLQTLTFHKTSGDSEDKFKLLFCLIKPIKTLTIPELSDFKNVITNLSIFGKHFKYLVLISTCGVHHVEIKWRFQIQSNLCIHHAYSVSICIIFTCYPLSSQNSAVHLQR